MKGLRSVTPILGLLVLGACVDQQLTGPGTTDDLAIPHPQLAEVFDGSVPEGNPHFYFLRPTVDASPSPTGTFDGSMLPRLRIEICALSRGVCEGDPVAAFTSEGTTYYERIRLNRRREHYVAYWDTGARGEAGASYRVQVFGGGILLGYVDVLLSDEPSGEVGSVGSWLPVAFRVEEGALPPEPFVVDKGLLGLTSSEEDMAAGIYRFEKLGAVDDLPAPGDVLVGDEGGGFLREVESVRDEGDQLTVTTNFISMADAVGEGRVEAVIDVGPLGGTGLGFAPGPEGQWAVPVVVGAPQVQYMAEGARLGPDKLELGGVDLCKEFEEVLEKSCPEGVNLVIPFGEVDFDPSFELEAEFGFFRLKRVRAVANGVLTYDVQLDLSAEASFEQDGEKVLTKLSKPIFIPPSAAYPLPITGEVVLTVKVGFEAAAKARAELTAGFTSVHSASAGAEYADGMWSEILEFDHSADPVAPDFVGSAEAEGRVYVRPELAVNIYHVAGPFIGLEPGLAAFAEFSFMDEALFCSFVASGTLDALVGFDVRILDDDVDRFEKSFEGPEWFWSEFDCSDEGPTEPMLIAHYPLDGTGEDISGNGYDGTLVGATPAPDRFGDPLGALSFDGQGDYMTVPIPTQRYESFSICGWAAATGPNPAGSATRLLGGRVGGTRSLVAITYSLGDRATLVGEYGGAGSAGLRSFVDTGFNLFDGDWHHICMAAGPDDVVLYLDGREVGRDALRTSGPITTDIVLGAYTDNGLIEHGFVGRIDDLRLFDRPLSPEEVEAEWAPATE